MPTRNFARVIQLSPRAERGVEVLADRGLAMGCTASIPVLVRRHLDSSLRFAPFGITMARHGGPHKRDEKSAVVTSSFRPPYQVRGRI